VSDPLISIIAVNFNSPPWIELCVKSIRRFTAVPYELIVVDNHDDVEALEWLRAQSDIRLIENPEGVNSPGGAMDQATQAARGRYVCYIDSDAHFQRAGWEREVLALYNKDPLTRLVCMGYKPLHPLRPVEPPLFFYERDFFVEHGLTFRHDKVHPLGTDTAQKTYWDVLELGYKVELFQPGPLVYGPIIRGDEIWLGGEPTIYHFRCGSRLRYANGEWKWQAYYRPSKESEDEHIARAKALFQVPLVQSILLEGT